MCELIFSEREELQRRYNNWLIEESAKIGACLDASNVHTFIAFLKSQGFSIVWGKK